MLNINNITVQYGNNKPILENLSLEMKQGEIVSIVGKSGSGKTTVIRSVMGLLPAGGKVTKGDIVFNGQSLYLIQEKSGIKLEGLKFL